MAAASSFWTICSSRNQTSIEMQNLRKRYGDTEALHVEVTNNKEVAIMPTVPSFSAQLLGQTEKAADEDAIDAIRSLRTVMHGFVGLEAAGGCSLAQSVDATYARLIGALDTVFATWAGG
jgi:hypothetical protein